MQGCWSLFSLKQAVKCAILLPQEANSYYVIKTSGYVVTAGFGGGGRQRMGRSRGNVPRNNQRQNEQTNSVASKLKLTPKQQRELHDLVHDQGWGYQEILQFAQEWFGK